MFEDNQSGQVKVRPNLCYLKVTGVGLKAAVVLNTDGFDLRSATFYSLPSRYYGNTITDHFQASIDRAPFRYHQNFKNFS